MKYIAITIKAILYLLFTGITVAGILGLYTIVMNFGSGTSMLIAPSIFIVTMGVLGIIGTYRNE